MGWVQIYHNNCERYWDQNGQRELTIPEGSDLHYRHTNRPGDFPRPEMDHKRTVDGQSEVKDPPGASARVSWTCSSTITDVVLRLSSFSSR